MSSHIFVSFMMALSLFFGAVDQICRAEDLQDFDQLDLGEMLGLVSAASGKVEDVLRAPAAVTTIDAVDIKARGTRSLPDLLRTVPGIQVMETAPGNYVVSVRGIGGLQGNNVILLLDGVALNNPVDGNIDWAALPICPDDIAIVEVVRGPVSPIYGANAYMGVISIQTRETALVDGLRATAQLGTSMDDQKKLGGELHASIAGRSGAWIWRLGAQGVQDQSLTKSSGESDLPDFQRLGLNSWLRWEMSKKTRFDLVWGGGWNKATATDSLVLEPLPQQTRTAYAGLYLETANLATSIPLIKIWSHATWFDRIADQSDYLGLSYEGTKAYDWTSGAELELALPARITTRFGLETGFILVDAPYIHPDENNQARWTYAARVQASMDITDWLIVEGAARGDISAFTDEPEFSYRGSLIYLEKAFSVRLTAGSAYRNPSYVEAGGRFVAPNSGLIVLEGDASLNAPRLDAFELGSMLALLDGRLTLKPSVFIARARDLVVGDFGSRVRRTFRNDQRFVDIMGEEIEARWHPYPAIDLTASATVLEFLSSAEDPAATVGVKDQNSQLTAHLGMGLALIEDRLHLYTGVTFASARSYYNVFTGVPPERLPPREVPNLFRLEAVVDYRPLPNFPVWLQASLASHLPHQMVEAPYPTSSQLGTIFFLSLRCQFEAEQ